MARHTNPTGERTAAAGASGRGVTSTLREKHTPANGWHGHNASLGRMKWRAGVVLYELVGESKPRGSLGLGKKYELIQLYKAERLGSLSGALPTATATPMRTAATEMRSGSDRFRSAYFSITCGSRRPDSLPRSSQTARRSLCRAVWRKARACPQPVC